METPPIKRPIVHIKNKEEIILLLFCEDYNSAEKLDSMLENYSIKWDEDNEIDIRFYLRSPMIGGYGFKGNKSELNGLDKVNLIALAFQSDTEGLNIFPSRPLVQ